MMHMINRELKKIPCHNTLDWLSPFNVMGIFIDRHVLKNNSSSLYFNFIFVFFVFLPLYNF